MTNAPVLRARLERATESSLVVRVDSPRGSAALEYVSPTPVWAAPPATLDFVAVALTQYAASEGWDLLVEGPVTRSQLEHLDELQLVWSVWRPDKFRRVRLSATEELPGQPPAGDRRGAVMGFSGGVDSAFALVQHKRQEVGRLSRDVDLGVLVVGWDLRHGDEEGLRRARASAERALAAYDVELAVVSTNWQQDFCNAWFLSFTGGLAGVLHTFSGSRAGAVHATDASYREELNMPPYGSHMAVNHLLGSPSFPLLSTGGTHRRIERVAALVDHPVLLETLRVCYQPGSAGANCGHCEKCVRTQLELRAVGGSTEAFGSPLTATDIRAATANNPTVLLHFEDILSRLDRDDEFHAPVQEWVDRQRLSRAPRLRRLTERVAELERELEESRREAEAIRGSRSWQVTGPIRATTDRLRSLRG